MDPVGSGWPYAYNRLVASTATGHHNANAAPLIVQPTATPAYGAGSFLPPPSVGYDVFSTLFHPSAVAAQMNSQANLKSVNYNSAIEATSPAAQILQQEQSNLSSQSQRTQQYVENTNRSIQNAGSSNWNSSNQQQQLQFGLSNTNLGANNPSSNAASNSLATITRVNSNGGGGTSCGNPAASTVYDNYNAQLQKAHSLYLNSQLANAAAMATAAAAMASKLQVANANASRPTVSPQVVSITLF